MDSLHSSVIIFQSLSFQERDGSIGPIRTIDYAVCLRIFITLDLHVN